MSGDSYKITILNSTKLSLDIVPKYGCDEIQMLSYNESAGSVIQSLVLVGPLTHGQYKLWGVLYEVC